MLLCIALIIAKLTLSLAVSWEHKIIVDGENGTDNNSCLQDVTLSHCATLNMALKGLRYNSTVIYIGPGTYTMEHGNETSITGKDQIAIIGRGKENTVINCSLSAGLEFVASSNITIKSIKFQHCSLNCAQSMQFVIGESSEIITYISINVGFQAAITFDHCSSVKIYDVIIQYSNGTGLLSVCMQESLIIENSLITGSKANEISSSLQISMIGGGIILLEKDNCQGIHGTDYHISRSLISSNDFKTYAKSYFNLLQHCSDDIGGGVILILYNSSSSVYVDSCVLTNNTRGLSIYGTMDESIVFANTSIYSNWYPSEVEIFDSGSSLYFFDVNMTDELILAFHYLEDIKVEGHYSKYNVSTEGFQFIVHFSSLQKHSYFPLKFKQKLCTDSYDFDYIMWGRWLDQVTNVTLQSPLSYSYCSEFGCSCANYRKGRLCGQCENGYSVAINSNYLSCVPCDKLETVIKGWAFLIGLEFVPLTAMVIVIALLGINLNQGSLNAYILFCQILTVSFPSVGYPAWLISHEYPQIYNFCLIPLSIWNLNFINIPSYFSSNYFHLFNPGCDDSYDKFSICISQSTSPLGALTFWYLIALYPLGLLMLLNLCIVLYEKGHQCIVCFAKPAHRLLAHFWQMFNIEPSLSRTVASIYTLCFTQLAAISLKILHPSWYKDTQSKYHTVFFYDGTQPYFSGWHGLACTFAVLVLIFLISVTLYLLIHPFRWFQQCLDGINFGKDFLIKVIDAFTDPYKKGTKFSSNYQYFAGIHFALRLVIMTFYYIPPNQNIITGLESTLCVLTATAIIIFRPYTKNIHSFNEIVLILVLGVFSFYPFYPFSHKYPWSFYPTRLDYFVLPLCGSIIVLVVIPYCGVWMIRKCRAGCRYLSSFDMRSIQHANIDSNDSEWLNQPDNESLFADRLMNPKQYEKFHTSSDEVNTKDN